MKNIQNYNNIMKTLNKKDTWYKVDTTCNGHKLVGCGSFYINGEYTCSGCGKTRYEYMGKKLLKDKINKL